MNNNLYVVLKADEGEGCVAEIVPENIMSKE
jgi:hypothetical protein